MSAAVLLDAWEGRATAEWAAQWRVPELHIFDRVGSTNDVLRERALAGAPAGTTIIADHQSAGRGRLGRTWEAPPGSALLCSVLLRPAAGPAGFAATLPLRVGLAIAAALDRAASVRATLKWPNDVLLHGRKVAGILCEAAAPFVIAGVGINVAQQPLELPITDPPATSLAANGCSTDRATLTAAVLAELRPLFDAPHGPLDPDELARYAARDALLGRAIAVDGAAVGIARGIDHSGALLVERDGALRPIHAGTVRSVA